MSNNIVQFNEEIIKGRPAASCSRNPVGQQEIHEHEASGGNGA